MLRQGQCLPICIGCANLMIDQQIRPCYDGLKNNVSTRLMKTTLNPWPPDTVDFVNHRVLSEYIRDTSIKARVDEKTLYNIKVEKIEKNGSKWDMRTSMLTADNKVSEQLWVNLSVHTT